MDEKLKEQVELARDGNAEAMGKLFSATLKKAYFLALNFSGDEESAVEIAQKAYARVFCTLPKLKKAEAFEIWVGQNISAVYKETQKFTFSDAEGGAVESSSEFLSADILSDRAGMIKISAALKNLSPEKRAAIILFYYNGMPANAIAMFFGVSPSTVNALLSKARQELAENSGFGKDGAVNPGELPVMTKVLRVFEDSCAVPEDRVREIFTYAFSTYKSFKKEEESLSEEKVDEYTDIDSHGVIEDPKSLLDDIPSAPADLEVSSPAPTVAQPQTEPNKPAEENAFEPKIPGIPQKPKKEESFNFSDFNDEPEDEEEEYGNEKEQRKNALDIIKSIPDFIKSNEKLKKLDFKKLGIIAAVLIVLICIISGISSSIKNKKEQAENAVNYEWRPGGFEEVTDITYLDENCCVFQYSGNSKYGLLDYQGKILLQPNYDEFDSCSNGRDRTGNGNYHTKVKMGDQFYQFTITNGEAKISETPHTAHSVNDTPLESGVSYDERDRYFEGYAAARKKGKWGYVSQETGKKVIPFEYDAVNNLDSSDAISSDYCRPVTAEGLIPVRKDGYMGIINLENETVVPFEYAEIMVGDNGVFIAKKDGVWGVILTGSAINTFGGIKLEINTSTQDTSTGEKYRVVNEVNVRSDAGSGYTKLGSIASGQEIEVYAVKTAQNGKEWACIKYDNTFGYVIMSNLKKIDS